MAIQDPTTVYGYDLPTVGGSTDTWGTELNEIFGELLDSIDTDIAALQVELDALETTITNIDARVTVIESNSSVPVMGRLTQAAGQPVAAATPTILTWDTELVDINGMFDPASATKLTVPDGSDGPLGGGGRFTFGGLYQVRAQIRTQAWINATDDGRSILVEILQDGSVIAASIFPRMNNGHSGDSGDRTVLVETLAVAAVGSFFEMRVTLSSGSATDPGLENTFFEAIRFPSPRPIITHILYSAGFDNHGNDSADFDRYDSTSNLIWETGSGIGKFDGGALRPTTGTGNLKLTVANSVQRSGWATFYFKRAIDADDNAEFFLISGTSALHFWIEVGNSDRKSGPTDQQIILLNRDDTLLGTSINTFTGTESSPGPWLHCEAFWTLGQGDGVFKLWVDGTLEIDVSSLTLGHPTTDLDDWRIWRVEGVQGFLNANDWIRLDDLVIQDGTGAQLGTGHRIWSVLPDADGAVTEFTPSTGTDHFALVDDTDPDQDATYLLAASANRRDEFTFTLPSITGTIHSVVVKALFRHETGTGTLRLGMKKGTAEELSSNFSNGTTYKEATFPVAGNPNGVAWTVASLPGAIIVVEADADVRVTQVWLEVLTTS